MSTVLFKYFTAHHNPDTRRKLEWSSSIFEDNITENALEIDIGRWRQSQVKLLPFMKDFLDEAALNTPAKSAKLFLPSDLDVCKCLEYDLAELASCERLLREGEASDALCALQLAARRVHGLSKENKHMKKRTAYATRRSAMVNKAKSLQSFWMNEYRVVRQKLLSLGMANDDQRFRELLDNDVYRPDLSEAPALGLGGATPGWIWSLSFGDESEEPEDWMLDGGFF